MMSSERRACRLSEADNLERTREAEAAVLQLLDATDPARQKRMADGSWRASAGASSGVGEAPGQAILGLNRLYSSASPPSVSLIRHPQVTFSHTSTTQLQPKQIVLLWLGRRFTGSLHLSQRPWSACQC